MAMARNRPPGAW